MFRVLGGICSFIAILLLSSLSYSHAQRDKDSLALVALYNSTNGPNWTTKTNWLSSEPVSAWYGVIVGNGRVERLQIYRNNLSGPIPPEIGNLTNLKTLLFDNNKLTGSIPPEIGNLINLEALYLTGNQLTGCIPKEIGNLTKLVRLSLSGNLLSGTIPNEIGNLTMLKEIWLNFNKLSGSIPPEIGNLVNLENLMLSDNLLTGSIPPELCNLTNLTASFSLYNNLLSGSIPSEIGKLTKLRYLYLYNNLLSGSIPPEIVNMTSLQFLILDNNKLSGSIPPELWNSPALSQFTASKNSISGQLQKEIGGSRLFIIDLSSNTITGTIPPEIGNAPFLAYLFLNSNKLSGEIPTEIGKLTKMVWLNLSDNNFTGSTPASINNMIKLQKLWLSKNLLSDIIPFSITTLDSLWIEKNRFTFEDIEPLINVPKKFFSYIPQDSIGESRTIYFEPDENFTFEVVCGGSNNTYQWYKDNVPIPTEVYYKLTFNNLQNSDVGKYFCVVSNSVVNNLKIYSRPVEMMLSLVSNVSEERSTGFLIYPNPSDGHFTINSSSGILNGKTLEIIDINGSKLIREELIENYTRKLDLSYLHKGIYVLRIKDKTNSFEQKIVID